MASMGDALKVIEDDMKNEGGDGDAVEGNKLSKGQKKRLQQKRAKARHNAADAMSSMGESNEEVRSPCVPGDRDRSGLSNRLSLDTGWSHSCCRRPR